MDIEEYKKLVRNKIEADSLTRQVRNVIKETKWQKQDMREGFTETFKPLIDSQESVKKSIDEQQNATIAQLQANQLALTSGLEKINENNLRLAEMRELPALEGEYEEAAAPSTSKAKLPTRYDIEKNFNKDDFKILKNMGYPRPTNFFNTDIDHLETIYKEVKNDIKVFTGEIAGLNRKKHKTEEDKEVIEMIKIQKDLLHKYKNILNLYLGSLEYKMGEGIYFNNPHQLLNRLELLGGSILAGNNGVINEFSQIAHLLNQMKVITKKQLNDLLKTYIKIR